MFRNIITLVTIMVLALSIAVSAAEVPKLSVFGGVGDNMRLWRESNTFKYKNSYGASFGATYEIAPRWTFIGAYDYSARDLETSAKTLYVKEYTPMTAYLLTTPGDRFLFSLLAGVQVTAGNLPDFGTYLGFVDGGLISYEVKKGSGLRAWLAGTLTLGEDYQLAKLRAGLSYPVTL